MGRNDDGNKVQKKDNQKDSRWIEERKEQQNTDPKKPENEKSTQV